jgi:hypothetical protein
MLKMLGQITVDFRIARIAIVTPSGRHQKIHDVQAETEIASTGLFINECLLFDAADVTLLADARLQGIGIDLDVDVGLLDMNHLWFRISCEPELVEAR